MIGRLQDVCRLVILTRRKKRVIAPMLLGRFNYLGDLRFTHHYYVQFKLRLMPSRLLGSR